MCSSSSVPLVNRSPHNAQVRESVVAILVSFCVMRPCNPPTLESGCARCGGQMETGYTPSSLRRHGGCRPSGFASTMTVPFWAWAAFAAFIVAMLALDLFVLHRRAHEVSLREAAVWTAVWVVIGLGFAGVLWAWRG